jgi:ABC-type uncharacterized transport system substrate-binding protein
MSSNYGIFTDLVKTAGFLMSAVAAIGLTWRGRARWEPSEEDIPKGPQKVGGLLTAVALALLWTFAADAQHLRFLANIAVVTAIVCLASLLIYGYLISVQTYEGSAKKGEKKLIGGLSLKPAAEDALKRSENPLTAQEFLKLNRYDPDKVWTRPGRALAKSSFILFYLGLTLGGSLALTCAAMIILYKNPPPVTDKKTVQVGIVLTGEIYFTREIMASFTEKLDRLLDPTAYAANYEFVVGEANASLESRNQEIFESLLNKFPERKVDYLITIGTQASEYAKKHYFGRFPLVFIGVTDPIRSGLVERYEADANRGNMAGIIYGLSLDKYLDFFQRAFPGKTFGFVYNPNFHQDIYLKDQVLQLAPRLRPPMIVVPIEVAVPTLTEQQQTQADIFFGRYYVAANLGEFVANSRKPFVAGDISNVTKGAIACIAASSRELGEMAATNVVYPNLINGKALSEIPVSGPVNPVTAVNMRAARKYGLSIAAEVVQHADRRVE